MRLHYGWSLKLSRSKITPCTKDPEEGRGEKYNVSITDVKIIHQMLMANVGDNKSEQGKQETPSLHNEH